MRVSTRTIPMLKEFNNLKIGVQYEQTFLREHDNLGIVDPTYSLSAPCVDSATAIRPPGFSDPSHYAGTDFTNGPQVS